MLQIRIRAKRDEKICTYENMIKSSMHKNYNFQLKIILFTRDISFVQLENSFPEVIFWKIIYGPFNVFIKFEALSKKIFF